MTVATGQKGVDVRQTSTRLMFRVLVQDSAGAIVTTGTVLLRLLEAQSDGTYKTYDWADNTFKTTTVGTETASMVHRTANNGATSTGLWTYVLTTLTGFTIGAIYKSHITSSLGSPAVQVREWQFGSEQGDVVIETDGLVDVQGIKVGPTGSGTAQTAKDLGISLPGIAPDAAGGLPTVATGGLKLNKTVDLTSGQSIAVSDKTGFSLSVAGILAIWNQLVADAGIVSASFGMKLKNWVYGTDYKALMSTDAQDVSATLHVDAKTLNGATPNNAVAAPSASTIAGAVLDEAKGAHTGLIATALPAVAPAAAGGLPTVAAGAAKLAQTVDLTAGQTIAATVSGGAVEANVETHVSNVLNAAIPGSPTSNSVYDYIKNKLSQYAGGDTAGTTTLLGRIIGTLLTGNHSPQSGDSFAVVKSGGTGDLVALKAVTPASVIAAKSDLPSTTGMALEANVQGHVTDALNAAMPGTPTSGSAFDRIKSYLNASVSAIKTITDQFRFTIANQVDANAVSGGSTPPTPAQISAVVTPDVRAGIIADHGAGAYGPGGTGGAYTLTFTLRDSITALPIEAAQTELYSDAGLTVLVSSLPTNLFGIAAFGNLINETYYVKAIKTGYTTNSFTVVVSGNSTASGTLVAIVPVPVTPTLTTSLSDVKRGDTWDFDITVGNLTGYTSLWYTLKTNDNDPDASSILQIKLNASGSGGGLLYINGAPASSPALASLTITSLANGIVHCHVDQSVTLLINPRTYQSDAQTLISGAIATPISPSLRVTDDVTRAIA